MKRFLVGAIAALVSFSACAITYTPLPLIAPQAANTVVANVTSASASPTAVAVPGCIAANSALKYALGSGWSCGTTYALTSGTLSQFAPTTSAQLASVISDETGSGASVFAIGPAITLPNATGLPISTGVSGLGTGVAAGLATAVTGSGGPVLQNSPTINTPNITGVTSGSAAAAGSVGQIITPTNLSAVSMASGTPLNLSSVVLTAGDWEVGGYIQTVGAGTTVTVGVACALNTTSATLPGVPNEAFDSNLNRTGATITERCPFIPVNVTSTTTVFLVGFSTFNTSTQTGSGVIDYVRRAR